MLAHYLVQKVSGNMELRLDTFYNSRQPHISLAPSRSLHYRKLLQCASTSTRPRREVSGRLEENRIYFRDISGIFQRYFAFLQRRGACPLPVSGHFLPGASTSTCMMRHGFEFYDGYAILVSQSAKNERGGTLFWFGSYS